MVHSPSVWRPSVAQSREGVELDHVLEGRTVSAVRYTDPHLQGHLEKEIPDRMMEQQSAKIQVCHCRGNIWLWWEAYLCIYESRPTSFGLLRITICDTLAAPRAGRTSPLGAFMCNWTLWEDQMEV